MKRRQYSDKMLIVSLRKSLAETLALEENDIFDITIQVQQDYSRRLSLGRRLQEKFYDVNYKVVVPEDRNKAEVINSTIGANII